MLVLWLVVVVAMFAVVRGVVAMPQHCGAGTPAERERATAAALQWFAANQHPDGTFTYNYNTDTDTDLDDYNWVRHAGVLLSLEQARAAGLAAAGTIADRARGWALEQMVHAGPKAAYLSASTPTAGGTSLLVAALAERRETTGDTTDDAVLRALGAYLLDQVQVDGRVDEYSDPTTLEPMRGTPSRFTTGEVAFALARLERLFPGEGFGDPVRSITHYVGTRRALDLHVVPDMADHWMAYAMSEIVRWPDPVARRLTPEELAWGRKQMGMLAVMTRFESQRTGSALDRLRRGDVSIGSAVGTHGEALAGWAAVAAAEPALTKYLPGLLDSARCNAGLLAERQVSSDEAANSAQPVKVEGAWLWHGATQMDDQQHSMSALLLADARLAASEGGVLPRRQPVPESPWLMLLAAFAALNPVRFAAVGARTRPAGGDSADAGDAAFLRAGRIALAAVAAIALLAGLGLAGGWVWRTFDVSLPVGVIAAGLAVAAMALGTAARPFPNSVPASGWRSVAVPLLIPVTLRPELLLLVLAAVPAGRGWPFAAGVALAGACAAALSWRPGRLPGPVGSWLARLVALAALASGVMLIVDAVYAV